MAFIVFALLGSVTDGEAQSGKLIPISDLPSALAEARPGDILIVRRGEFPDRDLSLSGAGEKDKPIIIRAETPGGVIFTGKSTIEIDGKWITLDGFLFTKGSSPRKEVISISGSHCSLVNCVIDSFNPADANKEDKWVGLRGDHHLVENCTFKNKKSKSVTLTVWRDDDQPNNHIIRGNYFLDRPKGAESNGYETIRIGTSQKSSSDSFTSVTGNLFQRCDGEMEIISVKSGQNTISNNTFDECAGTLTLRHGRGSRVEGNLFLGKNKKETGGIRIYGADHIIGGNTIIGTTGRAGAAIALMCGNPNPKPNEFQVAQNVQIISNLLVANKGPVMKFDTNLNEDNRTETPNRILVTKNNISSSDLKTILSGVDKLGEGALNWDQNQMFQNNQIPASVTGKITPPLTFSDVGAMWFRNKVQR